jgi:creatinine amidohydrolase/Fe(II)-dependent formamide hydrolase-like protein
MSATQLNRYLAQMSSPAIAVLAKGEGVVILPIGAMEQHGPHLPVMTDTLIATRSLEATLAVLPPDVAAWALPPLPYGKSNEHLNFAGTVSLSAGALTAVLHDIAASVARAGFRRLAFLNGHGGNIGLLDATARDIRVATGLMVFCIHPGFYLTPPFEVPASEWRYGLHAGEMETSLLLTLAPELVQMDKAVCELPDFPETDTPLFLFGQVSAAWLAHDWSRSGVFGDATRGTAVKGEALMAKAVENLVKVITVMSRFEVGNP